MKKRNPIAPALACPQNRPRVVPDKRQIACERQGKQEAVEAPPTEGDA